MVKRKIIDKRIIEGNLTTQKNIYIIELFASKVSKVAYKIKFNYKMVLIKFVIGKKIFEYNYKSNSKDSNTKTKRSSETTLSITAQLSNALPSRSTTCEYLKKKGKRG